MWLFIIMLAVYLFLIILSYSSDFYNSNSPESHGRWYDVLFFLIDPGNPTDFLFAPFALIIAIVGMVIFSGMLISVISNILSLRVERYQQGEISYNLSHHVIILGFNRSIPSLIKKIHNDHHNSHILLMCEKESMKIRDWIHANIEDGIEKNLIIMNGDINAEDDLSRLSLGRNPLEIYILGESDKENHDDICLECLKKISSIYHVEFGEKKGKNKIEPKIPCYVQINSNSIYTLLQQIDFCGEGKEKEITNLIFHPFNFNEIWSQKVLGLTSFDGDGYRPLDGKGIGKDSMKSVHLIIVGMTGLGKSLAINAAQVLHFPNFKEGDFSTYTRITFIDPNADELGNRFRNRHSVLFDLARWKVAEKWHDPLADEDSLSPYKYLGPKNFMDIEWEFIKGDIADEKIRQYLKESCNEENRIVTVALCGEDSERNLAICMGLPREILYSPSLNTVLVRQKESEIAISLMNRLPDKNDKLRAFGMLNECYSNNLLNDKFGKLINALYCGLQIDGGDKKETDKIDAAWDETSITNRWSSNFSANMLFIKLRSLGLDSDNISEKSIKERISGPEVQNWIQKTEHNRWNFERITLGFCPLTEEEQDNFKPFNSDPDSEDAIRIRKAVKDLANSTKKHLDICSNEMLEEKDPRAVGFDMTLNEAMWTLYLMVTKSDKIRRRYQDAE